MSQQSNLKANASVLSRSQQLEELRVAQVELSSGDTSGQVYQRLSPGAVLFLSDRSQVLSNLSKQIQKQVYADYAIDGELETSNQDRP